MTDWVLCQITSNRYGDPKSVALTNSSFETVGLERDSFGRPGKLFTANEGIVIPISWETLLGSSRLRGRGHRHAAPRRGPISGPSNKALHQNWSSAKR